MGFRGQSRGHVFHHIIWKFWPLLKWAGANEKSAYLWFNLGLYLPRLVF
jgi:hypothetical protein